jgi:hypothetical protein
MIGAKKILTTRLPAPLYRQLRAEAARQRRPMSELSLDAIILYLARGPTATEEDESLQELQEPVQTLRVG